MAFKGNKVSAVSDGAIYLVFCLWRTHITHVSLDFVQLGCQRCSPLADFTIDRVCPCVQNYGSCEFGTSERTEPNIAHTCNLCTSQFWFLTPKANQLDNQ